MRILGISAFYHDSAAALVEDGRIVAAAQEERFTRKKHDAAFPQQRGRATASTRRGVTLDDVDYVVFYDKPFLKFERLLETYLAFAPRGFRSFRMAMPLWLKEKLFQKSLLREEAEASSARTSTGGPAAVRRAPPQPCGVARSIPRRSTKAVVLTMDGVGEWATTSAAIGDGNKLEIVKEIHFPHSLGLLYSAVHLLHRLQGQLRRIQGDGARALRRAEIRADSSSTI